MTEAVLPHTPMVFTRKRVVQTMRDRLIELVRCGYNYAVDKMAQMDDGVIFAYSDLADYLLANGVIVPPCKVGQIVWFIRNDEIIVTAVEKIILKHGLGLYIKLVCNSMYETSCNSIGKTIFFTKEEAEKALENRGE